MKKLRISAFVTVLFGWTIMSAAADQAATATQTQSSTATAAQTAAPAKTEKTEHNFEDLLVQGKYHFSDEAVTTVEEDKVLDSLLGVRTDFKDKIEQSVGRY